MAPEEKNKKARLRSIFPGGGDKSKVSAGRRGGCLSACFLSVALFALCHYFLSVSVAESGKVTESQNGRGWKGPVWVTQSNPPAEAGSPTAGCTGQSPFQSPLFQ